MSYISLPLPVVARPHLSHQFRHALVLLVCFTLYGIITTIFVIGVSLVINDPLRPQTPPSDISSHWFIYSLGILIGMIVAFLVVLIQEHSSKQWRWEKAIDCAYNALLQDASSWNWRLLGLEETNGKFTIDCVHGCYIVRFQAKSKFVYVRPGEADQVTISKIFFTTPELIDDIRDPGTLQFGGIVNVTYSSLSGPPELQDSYNLTISPRLGRE